jgi:predicted AAA+ superfamily ATPase
MYERNILKDLREWASRPDRKPLVLRGARQVGKTTAVNIFSREYDTFLSFNLDIESEKELFEDRKLTFDELMKALYFYKNKPVTSGKTLIFIDEIQNSPYAVERMRYFYESAPHLHVIAAGSLLESLIDRRISFPVGRVEYLFMRPLTFDEFLRAMKEQSAYEALMEYPVPSYAHEKLMKLFHTYCLIGGMPEIVAQYAEHGDIVALSRIYDALLTAYSDDVEKYASSSAKAVVIRHAIASASREAGQRIHFQNFGNSNYKSREMGEALRTLEKAMLIDVLYPVTQTRLPLAPDGKKSPKLLFLDTGLLNYRAGLQKELFAAADIQSVYQGKIAEHIVGQELISRIRYSVDRPSFWVREKKQSTAEVDYVIINNDRIIPVEVKSGAEGRLRSLHLFMDDAPHSVAVRMYGGKYGIERIKTPAGKPFTLINLPYYCACMIDRYCNNTIT